MGPFHNLFKIPENINDHLKIANTGFIPVNFTDIKFVKELNVMITGNDKGSVDIFDMDYKHLVHISVQYKLVTCLEYALMPWCCENSRNLDDLELDDDDLEHAINKQQLIVCISAYDNSVFVCTVPKLSDSTGKLINITKCFVVLQGHSDIVTNLSISPQREHFLLASASYDSTAQIWKVYANGDYDKIANMRASFKSKMFAVSFTHGSIVCSTDFNNNLCCWDYEKVFFKEPLTSDECRALQKKYEMDHKRFKRDVLLDSHEFKVMLMGEETTENETEYTTKENISEKDDVPLKNGSSTKAGNHNLNENQNISDAVIFKDPWLEVTNDKEEYATDEIIPENVICADEIVKKGNAKFQGDSYKIHLASIAKQCATNGLSLPTGQNNKDNNNEADLSDVENVSTSKATTSKTTSVAVQSNISKQQTQTCVSDSINTNEYSTLNKTSQPTNSIDDITLIENSVNTKNILVLPDKPTTSAEADIAQSTCINFTTTATTATTTTTTTATTTTAATISSINNTIPISSTLTNGIKSTSIVSSQSNQNPANTSINSKPSNDSVSFSSEHRKELDDKYSTLLPEEYQHQDGNPPNIHHKRQFSRFKCKSLFPMSSRKENIGKLVHQNDLETMLKVKQQMEGDVDHGTDSMDIKGEDIHIGYLLDRRHTFDMIDNEAQSHASKNNEDAHFCLQMFNGDIGHLLKTASDRGTLTDSLMALAPSVSPQTWQIMTLRYADQLEKAGQLHKAVSYLLAADRIYEAIDMFLRHRHFKEAFILAKSRLSKFDKVLADCRNNWIQQLVKEKHLEMAAKILISNDQVEEAVQVLMVSDDIQTLDIALNIILDETKNRSRITSGNMALKLNQVATKLINTCIIQVKLCKIVEVMQKCDMMGTVYVAIINTYLNFWLNYKEEKPEKCEHFNYTLDQINDIKTKLNINDNLKRVFGLPDMKSSLLKLKEDIQVGHTTAHVLLNMTLELLLCTIDVFNLEINFSFNSLKSMLNSIDCKGRQWTVLECNSIFTILMKTN